ncbi:MAG: hypothetical protein OHK0052_15730 [Anaerolineales bacterium]
MDPISAAILAALTAGAVAGLTDATKQVIVDAYNALKAKIQQKFGKDSDLADSVAKFESKPDSDGRKATLQEEVKAANAAQDPELLALAQSLRDILAQQGLNPSVEINTASGAVAIGQEAVALGEGASYEKKIIHVYQGPPPANYKETVQIYCRLVADATTNLPLRGVDRSASDPNDKSEPIGLASIYIDLDTKTYPTDEGRNLSAKLLDVRADRDKPSPITALQALSANPKMVLLGDPGGGKSTFVNYVAHCLAMNLRQPQAGWLKQLSGWSIHTPVLPVLVTLRAFARHYADSLPVKAEESHMLNFIKARLEAQNLPQMLQPLTQALEGGFVLLLLDGLDEVPTTEQRVFVRDAVQVFLQRYPKCRALITCRVLSYQPPAKGKPDLRLKDLPIFELALFDEDKIKRFIQRWYAELSRNTTVKPDEVEPLTAHLQQAVRRSDLARLASNPLLLTVMALVHTHRGRLPDARALLYEETMDILLWHWEPGFYRLPRAKLRIATNNNPGRRRHCLRLPISE